MLHSKFEFLFFIQMENIQKSADVRIPFLDNWKKNQNSIVKLNSKFREKTFLKHILFNRIICMYQESILSNYNLPETIQYI